MPQPDWSPLEGLTDAQRDKLRDYADQLRRFNQKMNLIAPSTEDDIATVHVLHSLALLYRSFPAGSVVVDWGTGGGLPALPLAICRPEIQVHAIDSVGKKVRAVRTMARRLDVENCFPWHGRADTWPDTAHYSVSRATASLNTLWRWHQRIAAPQPPSGAGAVGEGNWGEENWAPGLLCLKGGDLSGEIAATFAQGSQRMCVDQYRLNAIVRSAPFGAEKQLVGVFSLDPPDPPAPRTPDGSTAQGA
jgi:16S rRNA (guanine527-N7)-methyltransferase